MCTVHERVAPLLEQGKFCGQETSACRYVEIKLGRSRWEKRLAIYVQEEGEPPKIIIYKKPLVGNIYFLHKLHKLEIVQDKNEEFFVSLSTEKKHKVTFKMKGKDAPAWAAGIVSGCVGTLGHGTHGQKGYKDFTNIKQDLKDVPNKNIYTGSREGYVRPPDDADSGNKKKKGSGKSDEKKKKTPSKSSAKKSRSSDSKDSKDSKEEKQKTMEEKQLANTQTHEEKPLDQSDSDPDVAKAREKKTQTTTTECNDGSGRKAKQETPVSMTPASGSLPGTPGNEKKLTNSGDEAEGRK